MNISLTNRSVTDTHPLLKASQTAVESALKNHSALNEALLFDLSQAEGIQKKIAPIKNSYSTIAIVGIGGSSLGVQVLQEFFAQNQFVFFDNVDANEFEHQLVQLKDLRKTLWIFISKSGETIETLAGLEVIHQFYSDKRLSLKTQALVITENKPSSLFNWAQKSEVMTFPIPLSVGGRYSVLSNVGLVPAALMNLDISSFEKGARRALSSQKEISEFVAEVFQSYQRKEFITVLWSYSSRLKKFGFWWQQLWAESLGKKLTLRGQPAAAASTPMPLVGATDQHSVLQQVVEGPRDKFVIFLRSQASESGEILVKSPMFESCLLLKSKSLGHLLSAEAEATQMTMDAVKVSNMTLQIGAQNEESLGFLFMFFQLSVLALGHLLEINPVDQPGVEHGKKLCKQLLADRN